MININYLKRPFIDNIFLCSGIIIIEKILSDKTMIPRYIISSLDDRIIIQEDDFLIFKQTYLDVDFLVKYFFSYYDTKTLANKSIFIYERINFISTANPVFNQKIQQILISIDTEVAFYKQNCLKIDISSQDISIIDKINLLNIFGLLTSKICKSILNKKDVLERHIYNFFVHTDSISKRYLKEHCPNLIL